jgi:hypothetical protein
MLRSTHIVATKVTAHIVVCFLIKCRLVACGMMSMWLVHPLPPEKPIDGFSLTLVWTSWHLRQANPKLYVLIIVINRDENV